MILYPDFDKIKELCRKKIELVYPKYGNSWLEQQEPGFWKMRFFGEVEELGRSRTKEQLKSEIIDNINILTMWHQSLD